MKRLTNDCNHWEHALNARAINLFTAIFAFTGAILLSRMVLLLFAARPDNLGVMSILWLTDILVWPLAWIDTFQPMYGARFERGTLLECVLVVVSLFVLRKLRQ
jgi:hypothetical protein